MEVIGVAALTVGLTAGCVSSNPDANELHPPQTYIETTYPKHEMPDCTDYSGMKALGPFVVASTQDVSKLTLENAGQFPIDHPDASPRELVDEYMAENAHSNLKLVFDENTLPDNWDPNYNIFSGKSEDHAQNPTVFEMQKQVPIGKVANLLKALLDYPPEFLASLGVDTVRIANEYKYFAGHFDRGSHEILIEFDTFSNGGDSLAVLRQVVTHEVLGHAVHDVICGGNVFNDKELAQYNNGYEYLGNTDDSKSIEEIKAHYKQIPHELLDVGPKRTFTREYGASNTAEDFATIVEFTLEERGLILPGDPDYDSPLFKKQQLVVKRIEQLLPGFTSYAQQRTLALRNTPDSELNKPKQELITIPQDIIPSVAEYDPKANVFDRKSQVAVLNGARYLPYEEGRGGVLDMYPRVKIDPEGKIVDIYGAETSASKSSGIDFTYFSGDLTGGDVVMVPWQEYVALKAAYKTDSPEAEAFITKAVRTPKTTSPAKQTQK